MKKYYPLVVASYYKLISLDKIRFLVVGGTGFVVNYAMLFLLYDLLSLPIFIAQLAGAETALIATFVGNNFWAFSGHDHHSMLHKIVKFHASALGGLLLNSACVIVLVHFAHVYYGLALAVGSIVGLCWNYTLYKHFVFKKQHA
jgi:putative flippase GtrA